MDFFCFVLYNGKMKKSVVILACFFSILALAGCSLAPAAPAPGVAQKYTISKSIWISKDSGRTWKDSSVATNNPTVADINPISLAMDLKDVNVAYVGLRSGGIMKTTNGGDSWEFLAFKTDKIYGLAIDSVDSKIIYASTVVNGRGKIFKNTSAGKADAWTEIYTAATNGPLVISMALDRRNSRIIYVATSDNQVIKSTDGGVSWRNLFQVQSPVVKIALDANDSNLVYLLTQSGEVFASSSGGENFASLSSKISASVPSVSGLTVIKTDPTMGKWVYLAGRMGIIRSKDGGEKWESLMTLNNPQNSPVGALAISPLNSHEITYGALQATYKSIDEGKTWSTSQFDLPKAISILEYNPLNPEIVYAGFSVK